MEKIPVQSLERAFALLETLSQNPRGIGLVELSSQTLLHKSTVHRLLSSMIGMGYVVKDSFSGLYRLTYKLLELSSSVLYGTDILTSAKPHLDLLAEQAGESVHLVFPDDFRIVYVYKNDTSSHTFQMRSHIGLRNPMYSTAVGKSILATLSADEVAKIWDESNVRAITPNTVTTLAQLTAQLDRVRNLGYALDNEENETGVRCVGVSIPDQTGRAVAAISVSAPASRMTDERIGVLVPSLLACRDNIRKDLGYPAMS